jgi:long-subunit fatty acid transport protein
VRLTALAAIVALCFSSQARGNTGDSLGFGPREMALGLSVAARPIGPAATFYNPAALADGAYTFGAGATRDRADGARVSVAVVYAHPMVHATRDAGDEVPLAADVPETVGAVIGVRTDVGAMMRRPGIDFGLLVYVPARNIFRWAIHPDERVQWLFLSDRSQRIGIDMALGWRIVRWLSIGVGMRVAFDVQTFTTGRVTGVRSEMDPATGESKLDVSTQLGEDVTVYGRAAPTVGLLATPHEAVRIGASYRGKMYVDDWGATRIQGVPGAGDLGYAHRFAHYFEPHTATLAIAARPHRRVWVSADVAYERWSEALTTNHHALGPGRFGDTITPSFGVSWAASRILELRAGYRFVRSPFDNLGGPTNLLDNDSHVGSLGGEIELGRHRAKGVSFRLAWAARVAFLVARREEKDPRRFASDKSFLTNEGLRPYRHGGTVPGASLSLEASW